jgi:hypothetical protein
MLLFGGHLATVPSVPAILLLSKENLPPPQQQQKLYGAGCRESASQRERHSHIFIIAAAERPHARDVLSLERTGGRRGPSFLARQKLLHSILLCMLLNPLDRLHSVIVQNVHARFFSRMLCVPRRAATSIVARGVGRSELGGN